MGFFESPGWMMPSNRLVDTTFEYWTEMSGFRFMKPATRSATSGISVVVPTTRSVFATPAAFDVTAGAVCAATASQASVSIQAQTIVRHINGMELRGLMDEAPLLT